MTLTPTRPDADHVARTSRRRPDRARAPPSPRTVARRLFRAAVRRLAGDRRSRRRARPCVGRGGPAMTRAPARRVLRPARPRRPDRLRRGLPDRRLGRRGPRRLPHRAGRRDAAPGPRRAAAAARARRAPGRRGGTATPSATPATTSRTTTTCPTTCSQLFLDPTLSYSSALFATDAVRPRRPRAMAAPPTPRRRGLLEAQARKIERLLDQAGVGEGTRVLEIGTGWGELAIRAARRGARVHTSRCRASRRRSPSERIAAAGLADLVDGRAAATTARSTGELRRGRLGRDDRGGRLRVLADVLRDHRPACSPRAAGSRSRRSPCRTTGCWPPATPTPGSTSTSSPAASCPRSR